MECLAPGILYHDGAVALAHERTQLQVDGLDVHVRHIELDAPVEVDIESSGIGEVLLLLGQKENLLGTTGKRLRVHPHLIGRVITI